MKIYRFGLNLINLHSIHFALMNSQVGGLNIYEHVYKWLAQFSLSVKNKDK